MKPVPAPSASAIIPAINNISAYGQRAGGYGGGKRH
jgi:hypothetical protein